MDDNKKNREDEKIVLFPGLVSRLVEKGMGFLKEKNYSDALSSFTQAVEIEPEHPQGRFGIVLSLIELGQLREAKVHCEKMLKEDIGEYYDVLQVYISLLVQLSEYGEVVTIIEALLAEDKVPTKLAESFYQLLHFSRQMVEAEHDIDHDIVHKSIDSEADLNKLLTSLNKSGSPYEQWTAIQQLSRINHKEVIVGFKQFLIEEKNDPVLKSIILQILKDLDVDEVIDVHKFGKTFSIHITSLEDVFHEKFGKLVLARLANELEHENPTLYAVTTQLWWHYLFALYPLTPEPLDQHLWAAGLYKVGHECNGIEVDDSEVANLYDVDEEQMVISAKHMLSLEKEVFQGVSPFLNQ
ncbi:tetratricopeptide repeat protein [Anaerobacillus sp. MEB173]|uniref:tetratricopeptide repeat protein n=1 Tax=Anaerobacillus sp. MEB173 TaxID=3383345 RepID=UPI003F8DC93A